MTEKLYAVGQRECWKLGDHYTRNSLAMTAEGLHSKADIAAELGVRDAEIERLLAAVHDCPKCGQPHACHLVSVRPADEPSGCSSSRGHVSSGEPDNVCVICGAQVGLAEPKALCKHGNGPLCQQCASERTT